MNQITRTEQNQTPAPYMLDLNSKTIGSINYLLMGLRYVVKSIVREAVEEVLIEQGHKNLKEDKTLTASQLCERWNISANTLRNWEIDNRIAPLALPGRKKIYSLKDVQAAEAAGYIKNIA